MNLKAIPSIMPNSQAVLRISNREKGVLLLHGFKGSPFEMKYLGEKLSQQGYSISIPRLPGHGTSIADMTRNTDRDWQTSAREALVELKSYCNEVSVVGLSMGGILAILLAREYTVQKLALLSVPCSIKEKSIYLAPLVGLFKDILPGEDVTKGLVSEEARRIHESYSSGIPVKQSWHLFRLIRRGMKALPGLDSDILLMQSRNDRVIPPHSMDYIYNAVSSQKKEKIFLGKSDHAITADLEKEFVAQQVTAFLGR